MEFPDTLEEICQEAFQESGLEGFVAPKSLRQIGRSAFCDCAALRAVSVAEGCGVDVGKHVGGNVAVSAVGSVLPAQPLSE